MDSKTDRIPMPSKAPRIASIELGRLIGLMAVMYLHLHLSSQLPHWLWALCLGGWMSFFFFISAFFAARATSFSYARVGRYLLFYIGWNAIFLLMSMVKARLFGADMHPLPFMLARMAGLGVFPWDYPLWFLKELMIFLCMVPVFSWLCAKRGWCAVTLAGVFAYALWASTGGGLREYGDPGLFSSANLLFFAIGFWVGRLDVSRIMERVRKWSGPLVFGYLALVILKGLHVIGPGIAWHFPGIAGAILLAYFVTERLPWAARAAAACTPVFFFVYASHALVIELLYFFKGMLPLFDYMIYFVPPVIMVGSVLMYRVLSPRAPRLCRVLFAREARPSSSPLPDPCPKS